MDKARHQKRKSGRDINEEHRVSTPLELFFDLTFAIGLAVIGQQLSGFLAKGDLFASLLSFCIAMLAICWAWMNYSWFASAYDTDDITFRVATMIHMVGVIVFTLGLPGLFQSIDEGLRLDNSVMVLGYVIMRLAMIFLWIRAAKYDLIRRRALIANSTAVFIAQVLWAVLIFLRLSLFQALIAMVVLGCIEFLGPLAFYRRWGSPPWHPHHIADRYSCLAIIALGEGVSGAVAMTNAAVELRGWSAQPIFIGTACVGLAFGCWWLYFLKPFGDFLKNRRERASRWGYLHLSIFSSIVAMGAGLQLAGKYLEGKSKFSPGAIVAFTAISVGVYISSVLLTNFDSFLNRRRIFASLGGAFTILAVSFIMEKMNFSIPVCLGVIAIAPFVVVIGYQTMRSGQNRGT